MKNLTYRKIYPDEFHIMEQIYRLRYEVYSQENGFVSSKAYPDKREVDPYDQQSEHFAALTPEGEVVGTARLIYSGNLPLPIENTCPHIQSHQKLFPLRHRAEISRLIVNKSLRLKKNYSRLCDNQYRFAEEIPDRLFQCVAKCVTIGLCGQVFESSFQKGLTHWYALMEKTLWFVLSAYGFRFQCIGPQVDYFGPVFPYIVTLPEVKKSVIKFVDRHSCPILESRLSSTNERTATPYPPAWKYFDDFTA